MTESPGRTVFVTGEPIKNLVHALILLILFSKSSLKTTGKRIPFLDSVAEMTGHKSIKEAALASPQAHYFQEYQVDGGDEFN